ncbi:hypothetical protein GWK08_09080 [Leptobacterium flavescens]|uniref:DUF1080 domain-containing protein n=1 Tax=Leptobacterium flavescens TaxID=472055 RepID=A0A6P0UNU4_9FLAO|nr:hypothetical protein [Leptobacterium flavescens]NER13588.1 hypothetical protein [Leptobacterium flavescens]
MKRLILLLLLSMLFIQNNNSQNIIPLDTTHWQITSRSYIFENLKGKDAIYMRGGLAVLKDSTFLNGTIEFDVYLTERRGFPGIRFRAVDQGNMESFYIRAHLPGKPDANQAAPVINGITPWQFYFGPKYSFPYEYKYNDWTHIKLVINGDKAQIYMDYAEKPNFSWKLVHPPKEGAIAIGGGGLAPMHYANFKIDKSKTEIIDFKEGKREPIEGIIPEWEVSDIFEEKLLDDPNKLRPVINSRTWGRKIQVEEGVAANIARVANILASGSANTVFARIQIQSDRNQIKLFEFGYSDRVVAILNGEAIYRGNNRWQSRDYRYLGTIGLFDAVYLNLKKGNNTLLLAVSEDFGGWLVTGKFPDNKGIRIK